MHAACFIGSGSRGSGPTGRVSLTPNSKLSLGKSVESFQSGFRLAACWRESLVDPVHILHSEKTATA